MASRDIPNYVLYGEPCGGAFPDCLHCETISARSRLHDWHIRPHRHHGLHQFLWIEKGEVVIVSDDARRVLTAHAAVMNAPISVHGFEWEPESEGYVVTIPTVNLERGLLGSAMLLGGLDRSIVVQRAGSDEATGRVSTLFAAIASEYRRREEGRAEALLCQAGLLAMWFLRSAERQAADDGAGEQPYVALVRRFLSLVEGHHREHRPVSFYAGALGITPTHLSRACRRQLGKSAQAAIHDRLALEAKRLLAYTPASVVHVAQDLGFQDPAYFTRFFTNHVGTTPTAFRGGFLS